MLVEVQQDEALAVGAVSAGAALEGRPQNEGKHEPCKHASAVCRSRSARLSAPRRANHQETAASAMALRLSATSAMTALAAT